MIIGDLLAFSNSQLESIQFENRYVSFIFQCRFILPLLRSAIYHDSNILILTT